MHRLLPLLLLLLALPAQAQSPGALCTAMRTVVAQAGTGFDNLPNVPHLFPGSIVERRGVLQSADGPARAAIYAIMLRTQSRRPSPAEHRYEQLVAEIARCLPDAAGGQVVPSRSGALTTWTLPRAVVSLRREDGDGYQSTAEIELAVASRW